MLTEKEANDYKLVIIACDYDELADEHIKLMEKSERYLILLTEWIRYAESLEDVIKRLESKE